MRSGSRGPLVAVSSTFIATRYPASCNLRATTRGTTRVFAASGSHSRSPAPRPRSDKAAVQRASDPRLRWRAGGSNRRPSTFQGSVRAGHRRLRCRRATSVQYPHVDQGNAVAERAGQPEAPRTEWRESAGERAGVGHTPDGVRSSEGSVDVDIEWVGWARTGDMLHKAQVAVAQVCGCRFSQVIEMTGLHGVQDLAVLLHG